MDNQAKIIIGALSGLVVGLAIALAVSLASGESDGRTTTVSGDHYMGMMRAMGNMDSNAMLGYMRLALGEDGYQQMLEHMREHRQGTWMPGMSTIDEMMHRMMDGMMQNMPDDSAGNMPMRHR